jgi:hypothetical protein
MASNPGDFTLEYAFSPATDGEDRLARAYDLILDLMLGVNLLPEEDAVGAFPNVADAGEIIHSRQNKIATQLGASHAGF